MRRFRIAFAYSYERNEDSWPAERMGIPTQNVFLRIEETLGGEAGSWSDVAICSDLLKTLP